MKRIIKIALQERTVFAGERYIAYRGRIVFAPVKNNHGSEKQKDLNKRQGGRKNARNGQFIENR